MQLQSSNNLNIFIIQIKLKGISVAKLTKKEKEKVKDVYTKGLVSLEVIKLKTEPESLEAAEELYDNIVKHRTYLVDDLKDPYLIRVSWTENKSKLRSVDPDHMDEIDQYELSESIQEILKENNFPVIKSEFPEKPVGYKPEGHQDD